MELEERKVYQEEGTTDLDVGSTLIVIGGIFLALDMVSLLWVGWSQRDGSYFFIYWMAAQTFLGLLLIAIGYGLKLRAHTKEDA